MDKRDEREAAIAAMEDLYLWLGRAISDCSRVEKAVGDVYKSCFPVASWSMAMHSFYAIRGSDQRLTMTTTAVICCLVKFGEPEDLLNRWDDLGKRVKLLMDLRNKLAHGEVTAIKRSVHDSGYQISILPFSHTEPYRSAAAQHMRPLSKAAKEAFRKAPEQVSVDGIKEFTVECEKLKDDLREFGHELQLLQSE